MHFWFVIISKHLTDKYTGHMTVRLVMQPSCYLYGSYVELLCCIFTEFHQVY